MPSTPNGPDDRVVGSQLVNSLQPVDCTDGSFCFVGVAHFGGLPNIFKEIELLPNLNPFVGVHVEGLEMNALKDEGILAQLVRVTYVNILGVVGEIRVDVL